MAFTIAITASAQAYLGLPRLTVEVAGVIIGSVEVSALRADGANQTFNFQVDDTPSEVRIGFDNSKWGGSTANQRVLFIENVEFDGTEVKAGI